VGPIYRASGRVKLLGGVPPPVVLLNRPLVVHVEELADQLIDCVLSLDLDIHGDKEGEEEEDAAGEGHQLRGGQLRVWPHTRLNFTILLEAEDGDDGAGDHDPDGRHEHRVQHLVLARAGGQKPIADHKFLMAYVLVLA